MKKAYLFFILFFLTALVNAQTAQIKGLVLDEQNNPLENVTVSCNGKGTQTNANGFYRLEVPSNKKIEVLFSHISFKKTTISLTLKPNEDFELNPVLNSKVEEFGEVIITATSKTK